MDANQSPPPPPAKSPKAVAAAPLPKKKPWSKPTIRGSDGVLWTSSGTKFHTQAIENAAYTNVSA